MSLLEIIKGNHLLGGALAGGGGGPTGVPGGDGNRLRITDLRASPSDPITVITTIGVPVQVNASYAEDTNLSSAGFTFTAAGRITWPGPGSRRTYVTFNCLAHGSVNMLLRFYLYKNGAVVPGSQVSVFPGSARSALVPMRWGMVLAATDYLEIFVTNDTNTTNVNIGQQMFQVE